MDRFDHLDEKINKNFDKLDERLKKIEMDILWIKFQHGHNPETEMKEVK